MARSPTITCCSPEFPTPGAGRPAAVAGSAAAGPMAGGARRVEIRRTVHAGHDQRSRLRPISQRRTA